MPAASVRQVIVACLATALPACSSPSVPVTASVPAPYPATEATLPEVIAQGGPVMTAPRIVIVTLDGDPMQASIQAMVSDLVSATGYWSAATSEYGVGPLAPAVPWPLSAMAFTTDVDVQTWLAFEITHEPGAPQPDANTIYAVFLPPGAYLTRGGGRLCDGGPGGFRGYHDDSAFRANLYVNYAVIGRCTPPGLGMSAADALSVETARQIIDAATNPLATDQPAYTGLDVDHLGWETVSGAGVGDLCSTEVGTWVTPSGLTERFPRAWSNAAAIAGRDPCEPGAATPYFNSEPLFADTVAVADAAIGTFSTRGVTIPLGSTKTITVRLYSAFATSGPWDVSAVDATSAMFGGNPALSFSFDRSQGRNGDVLHLTIHAMASSPLGLAPFWIVNDLGPRGAPGSARTSWVGVVEN
jgi:hypothetical protein